MWAGGVGMVTGAVYQQAVDLKQPVHPQQERVHLQKLVHPKQLVRLNSLIGPEKLFRAQQGGVLHVHP